MKHKWMVALLVGVVVGGIVGALLAPQDAGHPGEDLILVPDPDTGCVTASVKRGSNATFLIVEVIAEQEGERTVERTGKYTFLTAKEGETEFCPGEPAAAGAIAASDHSGKAHIKAFKLDKAGECSDGVCVDSFEDYPVPWPPGS